MDVGCSESLTVNNGVGEVEWSSSDSGVAVVENGTVKAVGAGEATITASVAGVELVCSVTAISRVTLSQKELSLMAGESDILTLQNNVGTVAWSSSDTGVATVENGTVSAVDGGIAVIAAEVDGVKLTCAVTVKTDKTGLNALISEADGHLNASGKSRYYTSESWSALQAGRSTAQTVADTDTAKMAVVSQAESDLQAVLDGLEQLTFEDGELVYYPELSKQILEDINDYREENGLNRYEWNDNYALACREQASYNAVTHLLNYDAYISDSWDPARHASAYIGCSFGSYEGQSAASEKAADVLPTFQGSNTHNKNLLESWEGFEIPYGAVAFCSYTVDNRTTFVCMVTWGETDVYVSDYGKFGGLDFADYGCDLEEDIHNCKIG